MRTILAIGSAVVLAGTAVLAAQKPVKAPFPYDPFDFPAGVVCPFEVHIQGGGRQNIIGFPGREMIVGSGDVTVTNADTGASITLDSAGNFRTETSPDASIQMIASGNALFFLLPGDTGGPGLFHSLGRVVMEYDLPTDTVTSIDAHGRLTNVCSAIG